MLTLQFAGVWLCHWDKWVQWASGMWVCDYTYKTHTCRFTVPKLSFTKKKKMQNGMNPSEHKVVQRLACDTTHICIAGVEHRAWDILSSILRIP